MKSICFIALTVVLSCFVHIAAAEEIAHVNRFQKLGDSIIVDAHSGLMWATRDNGSDIEWDDAERYCENFEAGGYTDWRLPDLKELATLYTKGQKNRDGFFIVEHITLTDCCPWSSNTSMGGASTFSFNTGKQPFASMSDSYQARALPVRSIKQGEVHPIMVELQNETTAN